MTSPAVSGPSVLYVVYWGAREPLGQSQLLPWIRRLGASGVRLTLVTFEKPADLEDSEAVAATRASLDAHQVRWIPLQYHKHPKVPATLFDVAHGVARGLVERIRGPIDVIHARTFLGGLIGTALKPVLGAKVVFHGEGFWPDEQVDGGVWHENSLPHRVAKRLEARMYARADGIIAMSHRGKDVIDRLPGVAIRNPPVIVAPACPDPELFSNVPFDGTARSDELRLVYVGSVGYRYKLDAIGRFLAAAAQTAGGARLRILSRADAGEIGATLDAAGAPRALWSLEALPHRAVPAELARHDAGLLFLNVGLSAAGGSSTKVGEYWASGLPVVATPDVADTDAIIRREKVGVVVAGHSAEEYARAVDELRQLLRDPDLRNRCRRAAASHYAMGPACERQVALYRALAAGTGTAIQQPSRQVDH